MQSYCTYNFHLLSYQSLCFRVSGEIHGTLHRKVLENYQAELAQGAGLILKHVSIMKVITTIRSLIG